MAFSHQGNYGYAGSKTTGTSISMSPSSAINVGELAIVAVVTDNQSGTGGDSTDITISDDQSNSWTRLFEYTQTGGSSNDGVTISVSYSIITTQIGTGDSITATHNNIPAKAITCDVWTCNGIDSVETPNTAGGSSTSPSATISGLSSGERLWIGSVGWEHKSSGFSEDAGFSTSEQANFNCGDTGGPTSCVSGALSYLVATSTGDTYAPTIVSADWAVGIVALVETAGATPVNKDIQAVWDIDVLVNKDIQAEWDLFNLVNKDNQAVWDIFTLVNKDTQVVWDIDVLVNKDLQAVWDMEGVVYKDMQVVYDLLNLVNKDNQAVWDIDVLVNKDLQVVYDLAELVYKDIQAVWDMSGSVNKDMQIVWDLLNLVNKDMEVDYDIFNLVNKDMEMDWDLLNLVNKDIEAVWDMSGIVYDQIQAVWDIFDIVSKDNQSVWDILNLVNKDSQAVWDIENLVNKDIQAVYDIEQSSGTVNKDIQIVWDLNGEPVAVTMSDDEDMIQGYRR